MLEGAKGGDPWTTSSKIGEVEEVIHEEDRNLFPIHSEKDEETLHEYEKVSIENTEYELEEIQTLDVVEEELELSLDEGYAIFKKSMTPLHWNPSMTKVSHVWRCCMILPIWILPMIKIMNLLIICMS